jgi:hypothetical protein
MFVGNETRNAIAAICLVAAVSGVSNKRSVSRKITMNRCHWIDELAVGKKRIGPSEAKN